jgi:hypothetical protein
MDGSRIVAFGGPEYFRPAAVASILLLSVPAPRLQILRNVIAEGSAMRRKMWPVHSAAIKELFEDHIAEREAAQIGHTLRRILDAAHERSGEGWTASSSQR